MKKIIRFGVIGCSSIARRAVLPAINNASNTELEVLGSRSLEKAKKFSIEFSCESYGNYDEVLENKKIDAIYISLPISLQEKWVIKSAKAGKHVICEKSSSISFKSAKRMIQECRKNSTRLMEGFAFKFHPQHKKILELIKKGSLGKIISFSGRYGFVLPYSKTNFRFNKKLGGGALNDVGCYLINASSLVLQNEPISVRCNLEAKENKIDTNGSIYMEYQDNKSAYGVFGYNNFFQSTYNAWGRKAFVKVNRAFNIRKNMSANISLFTEKTSSTIRIKPVDQYKIMIEEFSKELQFPGSSNFDFETDFILQAKIMEAARKSNLERRMVSLSNIK